MTDMAALYEGAPDATLNHPFLPEATLHIVADGRFYARASDADGDFTIPEAGAKVWAGLPFAASLESLNFEMGGDNGAARARKARFGRAWCEVIGAQGLAFGPPGDLVALEELEGDSDTDSPFAAYTGFRFREATGDWTRAPRLRIERQAPFQATVAAWGGTLNMEAL